MHLIGKVLEDYSSQGWLVFWNGQHEKPIRIIFKLKQDVSEI
jgi:hypothetical protein